MQVFLVGGAVRDRLLGRTPRERDWVVVGSTPAEMESLGYHRVGRAFPVYLHPETGDEYALARTERKTGPGYRGFEVDASPAVSLEDDLRRRDLTINAMAETADGRLIDPWGGRADLEARLLRHVSPAFSEDPVRILRVARFAARYHGLGFRVAPETRSLMAAMVQAGEADALVPERVWQETEAALGESWPQVFFQVLRDCGALAVVFPEVDALFGVPQPERWHPEVDTGVHVLMALEASARLGHSTEVRFAVLVHDLGKGTTPPSELPRHVGHEQRGVALAATLCERLGVPNRYRELALAVTRSHGLCHKALELRPATVVKLLEELDAFRRPERFDDFLAACEADARGRTGMEDRDYPQFPFLRSARDAARAVTAAPLVRQGLEGAALGEALHRARIEAVAAIRAGFPPAAKGPVEG
jgi:tRNA nucleotidyltransferase (CCA-adding enzyme)